MTCPYCGGRTRLQLTVGNLARFSSVVVLHVIALAVALWIGGAEGIAESDRIAFTRRCRQCGAVNIPSRKKTECAKCGYDLTGNTSGSCPECGWLIRKLRKGFVERRIFNRRKV